MPFFKVIFVSFFISFFQIQSLSTSCPLEEDITNIARCIQVDVTAIIYAVRGQEDLTSFCQLADRYMECFKTYTRGCVGYHVKNLIRLKYFIDNEKVFILKFAEGTLTELQNIALYCCQGIFKNPDCPLNSKFK
jgi:hypothetical protein